MTSEFFNSQWDRMRGMRFVPAERQGHWDVLSGLPDALLDAAVTRAIGSQSDFPTPHELLTYADLVKRPVAAEANEDRRTPLDAPLEFTIPESSKPVRVTHEWRYDCERCSDSGMVSFWCAKPETPLAKPWYHRRACERRGEHYEHEWVGPCPCAATNPTIQRRLAARQKYAQEPAKAS